MANGGKSPILVKNPESQSNRCIAIHHILYPLICRQGTMLIAPREIGRTALAHL